VATLWEKTAHIAMDKTYIDNTLSKLYSSLGIHKVLSAAEFCRQASHSIERANKVIADHLRIENPISISFVPESSMALPGMVIYNRSISYYVPGRIKFPTGPLFFGGPKIPISIEMDEKFKNDIHAIGAILAHENTHFLLKLLFFEGHEMYTDLATMVLGLGELMREGRHPPSVPTSTIGYLDNETFDYAYDKTITICRDSEQQKAHIYNMWQKNKKLVDSLEKTYQLITTNLPRVNKEAMRVKIKPSEGREFVEMNNFVFENELPRSLSIEKNALEKIGQRLIDCGGFLTSRRQDFEQIQSELNTQADSLQSFLDTLQKWLKLQEKHIRPRWYRKLFV
jgi:hypothetical protein